MRPGLRQEVHSCYGMDVTHCPYCHAEAAEGYETFRGLWNEENKWVAMVCCAVAHAIDGAEKTARWGR